MDQLDLQSALHILVNADMRLTAAVIERPGTQLITAATLPAWNSALMSLLLFTHIPTPAAVLEEMPPFPSYP